MNLTSHKKKLTAGAVAGIAALALIGGGTFALWSDFETFTDNEASAGKLDLVVGNGPVNSVGKPLAPGEKYDYEYFLGSADLQGVPSAKLALAVTNVQDFENGCSGGEGKNGVDTSCADPGDGGEFSQASNMRIRWTNPIPNATAAMCKYDPALAFPNGNQVLATAPSISTVAGSTPINLGNLTKGQGVCVRVDVALPGTADNSTQGDSATYDLKFDLTQNVGS